MTEDQKKFYKNEFKANLLSVYKMLSFWVVAIATGLASYWLQMSPEDRQALLDTYPVLSKLAPVITMFAWVYARAKPQKSLTPPPEEVNTSEGNPN